MRAALSLEAIYAIPAPTWRALFTALGAPPPADDHAAIAASLAGDLSAPLARALFVIEAFATEAARAEIYAAAAALDPTALLPHSTSPADLIAQLVAYAPRDPAIAAILDAAKILRSRQYPPRTTYVFLLSSTASNGSDTAIGDPSQYADAWAAAAKSWCTETGRGDVVSVSARADRTSATFEILHEDRAQTRLTRTKRGITPDVARPLRSHRIDYEAPRLSITTDAPDAAIPLAQIAGAIFFDDARAFLRQSPFTLRPLQARGAAALDEATAGGELASLRAISGTWHSGKNHAVTPRGQSFFEALERYKIRIDGGRLEAVTLRASLRSRDGSPAQCDVAIRPPHLLTLSNPESAPLLNEALDLARITRADEPALDFFSIQPWIQTRAGWTASVGDAFDALVKEGVLVADKHNRAVAHPDYPYAGRVFVAFPLADGRWLATNPDMPIAPFVCTTDDLVVYRLSFEKLAAKIASAMDLDAPATALDDDGVLFCGARALGPTKVLLYLLTRPIRAASFDRLRVSAAHGHAVIIAPRARFTPGALTHVAMPPLAGPWRAILGDVVRAMKLEPFVDTIVYAPQTARVVLHKATQRAWIDGVLCDKLSEYHFRLLEILAERTGQLVHTKEIADHVSQGNMREDTTRKAMDGFFAAVEKSFKAAKKKPPRDLDKMIEMPKHGSYRLGVEGFVD